MSDIIWYQLFWGWAMERRSSGKESGRGGSRGGMGARISWVWVPAKKYRIWEEASQLNSCPCREGYRKSQGVRPGWEGLAEVPYSLDLSEPCAELIRCTSLLLVCLEVIAKADPGQAQQGVAAAYAAPAPRLPLPGDGGRASRWRCAGAAPLRRGGLEATNWGATVENSGLCLQVGVCGGIRVHRARTWQ